MSETKGQSQKRSSNGPRPRATVTSSSPALADAFDSIDTVLKQGLNVAGGMAQISQSILHPTNSQKRQRREPTHSFSHLVQDELDKLRHLKSNFKTSAHRLALDGSLRRAECFIDPPKVGRTQPRVACASTHQTLIHSHFHGQHPSCGR